MAKEIREIPDVVQRQIDSALDDYYSIGTSLRDQNPYTFLTCARGTSDQAALYFKYLMEIYAGVPVTSLGPSVASIYESNLRTDNMVCVSISQSGGSPDLVNLQASTIKGGAHAIALLNTPDSPLGNGATDVFPLLAGPERAVAATKSYVASLVAAAALVAGFTKDKALLAGIMCLPDVLEKALSTDWREAQLQVGSARSLFILSRGPTMAAAGEAALKLKETCRLHAEVYSAAEVLHGPIVLAERRFCALSFVPDDAGGQSIREANAVMRRTNASVLSIGANGCDLAVPKAPHEALAAIIQITAFYKFIEELSVAIGENPDSPPGLNKVTQTL